MGTERHADTHSHISHEYTESCTDSHSHIHSNTEMSTHIATHVKTHTQAHTCPPSNSFVVRKHSISPDRLTNHAIDILEVLSFCESHKVTS